MISKKPDEREALILEELAQAIRQLGGRYVLPFRFRNASGTRTSHSLVFVSKHFKGYEIMKEIMAKESSVLDQGVPSLTYSPADASTPLLFSLARPLDQLQGALLKDFSGQTISLDEIYLTHNVDTPYIRKNYREALIALGQAKKIETRPPAEKRRKGTFAPHVVVTFPKES
jgi:hypothetical protein